MFGFNKQPEVKLSSYKALIQNKAGWKLETTQGENMEQVFNHWDSQGVVVLAVYPIPCFTCGYDHDPMRTEHPDMEV